MSILKRFIRKAISRAANLTPGVVYYAADWPACVNERLVRLSAEDEGGRTPMSVAAIAMACAFHESLTQIGDRAEMRLTGVTRQDEDVGSFHVTVVRIDDGESK